MHNFSDPFSSFSGVELHFKCTSDTYCHAHAQTSTNLTLKIRCYSRQIIPNKVSRVLGNSNIGKIPDANGNLNTQTEDP